MIFRELVGMKSNPQEVSVANKKEMQLHKTKLEGPGAGIRDWLCYTGNKCPSAFNL